MLRTYEYRIYPNKSQEIQIAKQFGCCRVVYNKTLALRKETYEMTQKHLSKYELINEITKWKEQEEFNWLEEVNAQALQQAVFDMDSAYQRFFREKTGFPKFKSKRTHRHSFRYPSGCKLDNENNKIFLPKLKWVKCKIDRPIEFKLRSVTVKQVPSGKYFVCCLFDDGLDLPPKLPITEETTVGIDLGLKDFAVLSNGTKIPRMRFTKQYEKQLAKLQKSLSRKQIGSNNREKARIKVARLQEKISNCRKDYLHKVSHKIINENQVNTICLETLNISGMMKSHRLAKSVADVGMYMFKQMLEYKADRAGKNILYIGQYEPSTKLCDCGYKNNDLTLADREWTCPKCGRHYDRDIHAAENIKKFALSEHNIVCHNTRLGKSVELAELLALVKA